MGAPRTSKEESIPTLQRTRRRSPRELWRGKTSLRLGYGSAMASACAASPLTPSRQPLEIVMTEVVLIPAHE